MKPTVEPTQTDYDCAADWLANSGESDLDEVTYAARLQEVAYELAALSAAQDEWA